MQYDQREIAKYGLGALILAALAIIIVSMVAPTKAKANPGCSVGAGAAHVSGHIDTGTPINIGAEGQKFAAEVACDAAIAKDWMAGIGINYGLAQGDLDKIGVETDLTIFGRVGPKVGGAWVYGHVGHSWVDTTGGQIDGWKYGVGAETRLLADSPVYFDLRYSRGRYDNALGSGLNVDTDEIMGLLKWKFEPKQLPIIAPYLDNGPAPKAADPKMPAASPKKR